MKLLSLNIPLLLLLLAPLSFIGGGTGGIQDHNNVPLDMKLMGGDAHVAGGQGGNPRKTMMRPHVKNAAAQHSTSPTSTLVKQLIDEGRKKLIICQLSKAICSPNKESVQFAFAAGAKMSSEIWFIGGWLLSLLGFIFLGVWIWMSKKADGLSACGTTDETDTYHLLHHDDGDQEHDFAKEKNGTHIECPANVMGSHGLNRDSRQAVPIPISGTARYAEKPSLWWETGIARQSPTCITSQVADTCSGNHRKKDDGDEYDKELLSLNCSTETTSALPRMLRRKQQEPCIMSSKHREASDFNKNDKSSFKLRHPTHNPSTSIRNRIPANAMRYWTDTALTFTEPLLTFKTFIVLLLFIELNDIMVPAQSVLATPETISIIRKYPKEDKFVYPYAELLMPNLVEYNVDAWVQVLQVVRAVLLLSWFAFLIIPKKHGIVGGAFYAVGAILYFYLGTIGLMYNLSHSAQGGILFVLFAIPVVPFLDTSIRANTVLRKTLYVAILAPSYLLAGISKVRYHGIIANLTGSWLEHLFRTNKLSLPPRVILKSLHMFIGRNRWGRFFFSWGNIVLQFVLPVSIVLFTECWQLQLVFHAVEVAFHISVVLLIGPNFARYGLLHLLAMNPLGYVKRLAKRDEHRYGSQPTIPRAQKRDWACVFLAIGILLGWFYTQFKSDVLHLTGAVKCTERIDPYFPFPELSMYTKPTEKSTNIGFAFVLTTLALLMFVVEMIR